MAMPKRTLSKHRPTLLPRPSRQPQPPRTLRQPSARPCMHPLKSLTTTLEPARSLAMAPHQVTLRSGMAHNLTCPCTCLLLLLLLAITHSLRWALPTVNTPVLSHKCTLRNNTSLPCHSNRQMVACSPAI